MTQNRRRGWKAAVLLAAVSSAAGMLVLEGATRFWLVRVASADQLRVYGTFDENRRRFESEATKSASRTGAAPKRTGETLMQEASQSGFMYEPHRYIGYVPAANFRRGANRHNQWGYRGEDFPLEKPAGEFRIACLGGSTTYTSAVEDYTKSFPDQLQRILRDRGLTQVRVINAGVPGWTSYEMLANYEFRLVETDPDLLLIYEGVNDMAARMVWPHRAYRADNSGSVISPAMPPAVPWYAQSDFVRTCLIAAGVMESPMALHEVYGRMAPTNEFWAYRSQDAAGTFPKGRFEKHPLAEIFRTNPPVHFARNIEHLIVLAKSAGREVALLTFKITPQTTSYLNRPEFYAAIAEQNLMLAEMGQRYAVPVYDFASVFPDEAQYYVDAVHVNEAGARLQAEIVARMLLDGGGLAGAVRAKTAGGTKQ